MKRGIFLTSFFSMKLSGSKFLTSAAIWHAKQEASKLAMRSTPLFPASTAFQTASVVLPTPQIRPMPVITTRRDKLLAALSVFSMLRDVIDSVRNSADFFGILVGNFDVESFFESHDEFDRVERIGAKIVDERSAGRDLALVHTQLLHNNLLHLLINSCHVFLVSESGKSPPGLGQRCRFTNAFFSQNWMKSKPLV